MSQELDSLFEQDRAHFMHPSTHAHDHASGALKGRKLGLPLTGGNVDADLFRHVLQGP